MEANNNYNWRPNDNSSTTNLKYNLEADHWLKSIKHNKNSKASGSMLGDISNMLLVVSFIINIISLIVMVIWAILKWIVGLLWTSKEVCQSYNPYYDVPPPQSPRPPLMTSEEIGAMWDGPSEPIGDIWDNEEEWSGE